MSNGESKATDASNERLGITLNFVKFLLGTVVLGTVTLLINSEIQKQRLEFEIKSKENDFIAQFVDRALDQDPEKRRDFAEYFVRLTPSPESKKRWEDYRDYAEDLVRQAIARDEEIEKHELELAGLREQLASASEKAETREPLKEDIAKLQTQLSSQRRELAALRSEPVTIAVPNLLNIPPDMAMGVLARSGLKLGQVSSQVSSAPIDTVIRQSPPSGSRVAPGARVDIMVSGGSQKSPRYQRDMIPAR